MDYKGKVVIIGLLFGALLAGCSQNENSPSTPSPTPATEQSQNENSTNKAGEEMTEAEPLSYTAEQKMKLVKLLRKPD